MAGHYRYSKLSLFCVLALCLIFSITSISAETPEDGAYIDWEEAKNVFLEYFPLDGSKPKLGLDSINSIEGRRFYRRYYMWYARQPHLYVSPETHSKPLSSLAMMTFVMFTSNDSERCIQIGKQGALVDLLGIPFYQIFESGWSVFGMLHEIAKQLQATSGWPLINDCDEFDE